MKTSLRITAAAVIVASAVLLPAGLSGAQSYDTPDGGVTVGSSTLTPCQSTTVSAGGFKSGGSVTFSFDSSSLGTFTASSAGTASGTVQIPCSASSGSHTLSATGVDSANATRTVSTTVTVSTTTTTSQPSTNQLAFTGGAAATLALVAAGLVVAGLMLVRFQRRRSGASA